MCNFKLRLRFLLIKIIRHSENLSLQKFPSHTKQINLFGKLIKYATPIINEGEITCTFH